MKRTSKIILYSLAGMAVVLLFSWLYFYVPDIPVEVLNEKYDVKPSHYLKMDGMNVHYRIDGYEKDTIPLVLIHGTGSSLFTWNPWTELLKEKHKIVRFDLPGFGLTGPHPEDDYSLETYLQFLQTFLSRLGIRQCVIAGNSIGGEIAWRYALNHPEQVKSLILIAAAGYPTEVDYVPMSYVILRIPVIRELGVKVTPPEVIKGSLEYLYGKPERVSSDLVELYFDMTCREGNREALAKRMESISDPAPYEQLSLIKTPTLILWGEKDELIPVEYAHRFHNDLPNSNLAVFPGAGHMPMEEIPEKTAPAVEQFLKSDSLVISAK